MDKEREIRARANGPSVVPGEIRIVVDRTTPPGKEQSAVALCQFGGSSDKPFCDGTHKHNGLVGPEVVLTR